MVMTMKKQDLTLILTGRRKEKDLSQEAVVDLSQTGITRQFYSMIENGDRRPSVDVAKALGKVLDINWTIFFEAECNVRLPNKEKEVI
jgi:transcriptional regulator with XRE-family HTH domain